MFRKAAPYDDSKVWDEIKTIRETLSALEREMKQQVLDYDMLYEKVRINLAKLSKRTERAEIAPESPPDMIQKAREALVARKLARG